MPKAKLRSNGTRLLSGSAGDNPKLMGQELSDGRISLYLEAYLGYEQAVSKNGKTYKKIKRYNERLGLYLWTAPRSRAERDENRVTLERAKVIRFERSQDLLSDRAGYRVRRSSAKVNLIDWLLGLKYPTTSRAEKAHAALLAMCRFLAGEPPTHERLKLCNRQAIVEKAGWAAPSAGAFSSAQAREFAEWLSGNYSSGTAQQFFSVLRASMQRAVEAGIIAANPCDHIAVKRTASALKEILSPGEMQQLAACRPGWLPDGVRRGFLFTLCSGVRWCDVSRLRYADVDLPAKRMQFTQHKTGGTVILPLNGMLLQLIGTGGRESLIFPMPAYAKCRRLLSRWVEEAGIDKHITWHCGRHTFAMNVLTGGANVRTVASLLGHAGLQHVQVYTRALDEWKQAAIDSLPEIEV